MVKKPKRPRDANQLAKQIVDIATGEVADPLSTTKRSPKMHGRLGGLRGGKARAAKLTANRRREIARKAAKSRWRNRP